MSIDFRQILRSVRDSFGDDWLPDLYRNRIRTQRTRIVRIDMPERVNTAEIQYTLLGIELKVGKLRTACPDLATARYIRVFARCGVREFAIPYDITKISVAADELETAWHRLLLGVNGFGGSLPERSRSALRSRLAKMIREEIVHIGPGELMPVFDRETRRRT